jgi:xanthine dehydrogenase YagR molybdenum-binding subunit
MTMASVGSAVHLACLALRSHVIQCATEHRLSPLFGAAADDVDVHQGCVFLRKETWRRYDYRDIIAQAGGLPMQIEMRSEPGEEQKRYSMHSFGAVFVEVTIDPDLAVIRVRRALGVYAAGRIINPRLARSQCIGGMIGGMGMALMERTILDPRDGRPVNASLGDYLVPVNLDINGSLDAVFVEEDDAHVNPLRVKGVGELALIGMAPALANAVYHATGRRVRELPIRVESLL